MVGVLYCDRAVFLTSSRCASVSSALLTRVLTRHIAPDTCRQLELARLTSVGLRTQTSSEAEKCAKYEFFLIGAWSGKGIINYRLCSERYFMALINESQAH